jgi:hypothetical protein
MQFEDFSSGSIRIDGVNHEHGGGNAAGHAPQAYE